MYVAKFTPIANTDAEIELILPGVGMELPNIVASCVQCGTPAAYVGAHTDC